MSSPLTIADQIAGMERDWPTFKVRQYDAHSVTWVGNLAPQFGRFSVQIEFSSLIEFPYVRVLRPALLRLPDNPEGALPHVFSTPTGPILCLFDPKRAEWNDGMLISRTTVPWAIDWLTLYELWTMTGKWTGGGRHYGQPIPPFANPPADER